MYSLSPTVIPPHVFRAAADHSKILTADWRVLERSPGDDYRVISILDADPGRYSFFSRRLDGQYSLISLQRQNRYTVVRDVEASRMLLRFESDPIVELREGVAGEVVLIGCHQAGVRGPMRWYAVNLLRRTVGVFDFADPGSELEGTVEGKYLRFVDLWHWGSAIRSPSGRLVLDCNSYLLFDQEEQREIAIRDDRLRTAAHKDWQPYTSMTLATADGREIRLALADDAIVMTEGRNIWTIPSANISNRLRLPNNYYRAGEDIVEVRVTIAGAVILTYVDQRQIIVDRLHG